MAPARLGAVAVAVASRARRCPSARSRSTWSATAAWLHPPPRSRVGAALVLAHARRGRLLLRHGRRLCTPPRACAQRCPSTRRSPRASAAAWPPPPPRPLCSTLSVSSLALALSFYCGMASASASLMRSALLVSSLVFGVGAYYGMAVTSASLRRPAPLVSSLTLAVDSTAAWPPPLPFLGAQRCPSARSRSSWAQTAVWPPPPPRPSARRSLVKASSRRCTPRKPSSRCTSLGAHAARLIPV